MRPRPDRPRLLAASFALVLALESGCAFIRSDDTVSLVTTTKAAAAATRLGSVAVVIGGRGFGDITTKGKPAPDLEAIANRQLASLMPALRTELPAVLRRNGIAVHASADAVLTIRPMMASEQVGRGYSERNGSQVGITLDIELRRRGGAVLWRGTALERVSMAQPESRQWSGAMAEDLAGALLVRLRDEGLVSPGPDGGRKPN